MRRFRILQVAETLRPGGAENVVATLAIRLDRSRFDLEVAALSESGELAERIQKGGIPLHVVGKRRGIDLSALTRLRRLIRDGRYDLIHTHNPIANHWTVLASRFIRKTPPIVMTEHSIHYPGRIAWWYPAARSLLGLGNRAIIGVCEAVTESHRRIDPANRHRYRAIHNGIEAISRPTAEELNAVRLEIGLSPGDRVIGAVGNLRPAKAHDDLLDAFATISSEIPEVRLVVVGDGPGRSELASHAERLGVASRVLWLGRRTDVPRLLPLFEVFILSSRREGFPVAVLEAASAGVPIVATDVGGVREVIHDGVTGRLVPPARTEALSGAILDLLRDPPGASKLADAASRLFHEKFTAEAMTRKVESLYAEILERGWPTSAVA